LGDVFKNVQPAVFSMLTEVSKEEHWSAVDAKLQTKMPNYIGGIGLPLNQIKPEEIE